MLSKTLLLGGFLFGIGGCIAQKSPASMKARAIANATPDRPKTDKTPLLRSRAEADRKLVIAGTSLGLATAGSLFYSPLAVLSIPGLLFVSTDIMANAARSLIRQHRANVDLPISIIIVACIFKGYFFACTLNAFLAMFSRHLLQRVRDDSQSKVVDVFRQQPRMAWLCVDGSEVEVSTDSLRRGDIILVGAGETIPTDGQVVHGIASVDQHILTGEAQPAEKGEGETVFALTVVLAGRIRIRVEKAGEDTTAAQIGKILNETTNLKTARQIRVEALGDRAVLPLMVLSGLCWPLLGPASALAVLNAHPKYKATIASYIGILNFLAIASHRGILIKDGRVLERLNQVDTVIFDKTGTLTREQPRVLEIHTHEGHDRDTVLRLAAIAEHRQTHPIARAILEAAGQRGLDLDTRGDADYKVGYGLLVKTREGIIRVGSRRYIDGEQLSIPAALHDTETHAHQQGHSLVLVALDDRVIGAIELHASVREEAHEVIRGLRRQGVETIHIISGDHQYPTRILADSLALDSYSAGVLPENKAQIIAEFQARGKTVCFIGDGINDSIALKKADVSISLKGASTVAMDTAQIILMDETLNQLCPLFQLARAHDRNARATFGWVLAPHFLSFTGALFMDFGLIETIVFNQTGLALGTANAMLPKLRYGDHPGAAPAPSLQAVATDQPGVRDGSPHPLVGQVDRRSDCHTYRSDYQSLP